MANSRAKKLETFRSKYFTTITYEYRGHKYDVTYANSIHCLTSPAHIQHKDEQAKIDEMIDNPKTEQEESIDWNEIWNLMTMEL